MDKNLLTDAITNIDDDILEKALEERQQLLESVNDSRNNSKGASLRAMIGAAACLLIIASAALVYMLNANRNPLPNAPNQPGADITASPSNEPPFDYENSKYSAAQISDLFGATLGDGTKVYKKVYLPDIPDSALLNIPDSDTVPIFSHEYKGSYKAVDADELKDFADSIIPKLTEKLGIPMPDEAKYESDINRIKENLAKENENAGDGYNTISLWFSGKSSRTEYTISILQDTYKTDCNIARFEDAKIQLDDEYLRLKTNLDDSSIITSLENTKDILFDIFGVNYTDVRVVKDYTVYTASGLPHDIIIYYYNESDNLMNTVYTADHDFFSDNITIRFTMGGLHGDEERTEQLGYYEYAYISYTKFRVLPTEAYQQTDEVRLLSIEEAETLLNMGYVFGGHSCPICMEKQQPVDFTNYDYVGFEYLPEAETTSETGKTQNAVWIPFYTFYKYLETAPNGSSIYAKTYVPAIEVSGLPEFFSNQMKYHSDPQS